MMSATTAVGAVVQGMVTGHLAERMMVLSLVGTDYQLHLQVEGASPLPEVGRKVQGRIMVRAKRVDMVKQGGRFVEPVYGRPRRVQGRVLSGDESQRCLLVQCAPGCAVHATLTMEQKVYEFAVGSLVAFDVERGAGIRLE